MRTFRATPRASLLIESMRDIGYSLESALADIVDNSITAGAANIDVIAATDVGGANIAVVDDGRGMTEDELFEAMTMGCKNPLDRREHADLGRFGLGMKTASISQCRRLTVVTRRDSATSCARWDLDYVAETDDWLVQVPESIGSIPGIERLAKNGTIVFWELLDRAGGKDLVHRIDEAASHLELVFHRFLAGERGLKKIAMRLNGRSLQALDPFHTDHPATIVGPEERIKIGKASLNVQPYTLPHHSKVTPAEWNRYAGRGGYLKNQGFYVYREKRLIIFGTWFGLTRQAELTKLARVRIDISNDLDAAWKIDVKKASAQPPHQVRERLRKIVEAMGAPSKKVFTGKGQKLVGSSSIPIWSRQKKQDAIVYAINLNHPSFLKFADGLGTEARTEFVRVLELVSASLPLDALFADMGASPELVEGGKASAAAIRDAAITTFRSLRLQELDSSLVLAMMSTAEPFRSNWEATERHLEEILDEELVDG